MMNHKIEIQLPIGKPEDDDAIEFTTHDGNGGEGCTMSVIIEGQIAYEITVYADELNLQVNEYDGDILFEKSLKKHYYKEEEDGAIYMPIFVQPDN